MGRTGEHLSRMGARPHKWVCAPIKWVRALMMMGAHSLGWGRALINEGVPFLEKGALPKVSQ